MTHPTQFPEMAAMPHLAPVWWVPRSHRVLQRVTLCWRHVAMAELSVTRPPMPPLLTPTLSLTPPVYFVLKLAPLEMFGMLHRAPYNGKFNVECTKFVTAQVVRHPPQFLTRNKFGERVTSGSTHSSSTTVPKSIGSGIRLPQQPRGSVP